MEVLYKKKKKKSEKTKSHKDEIDLDMYRQVLSRVFISNIVQKTEGLFTWIRKVYLYEEPFTIIFKGYIKNVEDRWENYMKNRLF